MGALISRPLSAADRKILADKQKPSSDAVQKATDDLFLNLLLRVAELEKNKDADKE